MSPAYRQYSEVTGETSAPYCGGYGDRDTTVQDKWTVKSDLCTETDSRWATSSMGGPKENQYGAGGPSCRLPERSGQRKKESKALREEVHGFSWQQSSNYFFNVWIQKPQCPVKVGKQRAAVRKLNTFLQKKAR